MNKLIKKKIHSTELIWRTDLLIMSFREAAILKTLQAASQLIESQSQRPMELAPHSVTSHRQPHPPLLLFSHTDLAVGQGQQDDLHAPASGPLHLLSCLQSLDPEHICEISSVDLLWPSLTTSVGKPPSTHTLTLPSSSPIFFLLGFVTAQHQIKYLFACLGIWD